MTKITITRRIAFDAGHRIMGHAGKCATLHGHRYDVELTAQAPQLDALGFVIDFSVLKARVGGWIDQHWDHTMLLWADDAETVRLVSACPGAKPVFVCPFNPTAEQLAAYLLEVVCPAQLAGTGVDVVRVVVHETPNCRAEASS